MDATPPSTKFLIKDASGKLLLATYDEDRANERLSQQSTHKMIRIPEVR